MSLIDSHAHISRDEYEQDLEEVLASSWNEGLLAMINIIMGPDDKAIKDGFAASELDERIFCALGIHPHDAKEASAENIKKIASHLGHTKLRAVGEIGLDYYYENSPKQQQQECFSALLDVAKQHELPVCIHTRDAFADTVDILKASNIFDAKGALIHCFTGNKQQAGKLLDLGAYISFSGIVSFNKAQEVQEACAYVPLDRMMIETDAPFLAPVPHRGKRNEPAFVSKVAHKIAELKQVPFDEVALQTARNANHFFDLQLKTLP